MCSPTCCLTSLIINFVPDFIVFASSEKFSFQMGPEPGKSLLLASHPGGLAARIPGFHPGCLGLILGQGTKVSLKLLLTASFLQNKERNQASKDSAPSRTQDRTSE